jgi:predicted ArsR family transcriptional regulator
MKESGILNNLQALCPKTFAIELLLKITEGEVNQNLPALINELKNRARIYILIYRELSKEVGAEKATAILKRALYARGQEKGEQLGSRIPRPDLHELAAVFVEGNRDMDAFVHEVVQEQADHVVLRLNHCPLVEAWKDAGLTPEEQKLLCDIAYQIDFGKFEAAGYKLEFNCRIADAGKTCDMKVTL